MAFTIDTLGFWDFDNTLYDSVANNNFVLNNDDPYSPGPAVTGSFSTFSRFNLFDNAYENIYGLNTSNGVSYESDLYTYVGGEFTIGMWMKTTTALGFVRHFVTRAKTPKTSPVLAKGDKITLSTEEDFEFGTFIIVEEAVTETTNRLVLMLSSSGHSISHSVYSASYTPGLHHFIITYDNSHSRARIDVDGYMGSWSAAPPTVYSSSSTIKINSLNPNYLTHQSNNRSVIFRDLYFKNSVAEDENEAIRNYSFGVDYVVDMTLSSIEFDKFAISYTQPNTIITKSIVVNGSSIYLGMSNGDIVKGVQPIWDNEFTFDSALKRQTITTSNPVTYSEDGIILNKSFVKI